ncbi:hypothetical protein QTO34_012508 [Cnephaeus nilssonii]|uniref:40S ribosomal protein S15 n=1 Tax=Cnephaeus nilssonii TaxID=3371016 RepID=A0AA40HCB0_CNENI|nr:hypothetical protein QTO34_012508 [Eptesicus nilssonii]
MAGVEQKVTRTVCKFTYRALTLTCGWTRPGNRQEAPPREERPRPGRGPAQAGGPAQARRPRPGREEPQVVKMHLRDLPILPRTVVGLVGAYNSKTVHPVEIEPEMMISHDLGEFSITSRPRRHSRPALGPPTPASSPSRS